MASSSARNDERRRPRCSGNPGSTPRAGSVPGGCSPMRRRADRPRPQHQLVGIWNASRPAGRRGRSVAGTSRPAPRAYRCLRRRRQSQPLCATFIAGWRAASRPREPDPASGRPSAGHSSPLSRRSNASPLYELFDGILNPKDIEGLRLLVTPFPQQQFNQTEDRRREGEPRRYLLRLSRERPHQRCDAPLGDMRPQELAIGSIRRRCAASTSSACSARSAR